MIHLVYLLFCIPMCWAIQCNLERGKFFCDGVDNYDFFYHFYKSHPETLGALNYQFEIINSNISTLDRIDNPVLQDGVVSIISLKMNNCSIENIREDAFSRLYDLQELDLSWNNIGFFSAYVVLPSSLKYLNLSHNDLKSFSLNTFPSAMISVDISYNGIFSVTSNGECVVEELDMSNNRMQDFNYTTGLCYSKTLDITNNNMRSIQLRTYYDVSDSYSLQELKVSFINEYSSEGITNVYLKKLVIANSIINKLENDSFLGLYNLNQLDFPNTTIDSIEPGAFNGLFNLESLDSQSLFKNFEVLTNETFVGLTGLTTLNLSSLNLKTVESNAFAELENLKYLYLNNNNLSLLQPGTFEGLSKLTQLDLSNNKLTVCTSRAFKGLDRLRVLNLQNNSIVVLTQDSFVYLKSLEELHLENNRIGFLPKSVFAHLSNLQSLYLNNNVITKIQDNHFSSLGSLSALYLQNNRIAQISDKAFKGLNILEEVRLDNNKITSIDFVESLPLRYISLNVSNNKIKKYDFPININVMA